MTGSGGDQTELKRRFDELMKRRAGETAGDALARAALPSIMLRPSQLPGLRDRVRRANLRLISHRIERDERIDLIRSSLPEWASFLAAEVVHERAPEERQLGFQIDLVVAGAADD
ncbi:MAG: hypothetical protein EOP20_00670 [Hyphomicrobiales bacterium]|nr:MAG: hypothetical protein EOP20_00670 [Hyphomicrobiales bacterium]